MLRPLRPAELFNYGRVNLYFTLHIALIAEHQEEIFFKSLVLSTKEIKSGPVHPTMLREAAVQIEFNVYAVEEHMSIDVLFSFDIWLLLPVRVFRLSISCFPNLLRVIGHLCWGFS